MGIGNWGVWEVIDKEGGLEIGSRESGKRGKAGTFEELRKGTEKG